MNKDVDKSISFRDLVTFVPVNFQPLIRSFILSTKFVPFVIYRLLTLVKIVYITIKSSF